ncbi:hypothetical protein Q5P01_002140 [Channa striata]|uniref:Uncharacterized protein n=1 Tax=Channa striata TaxID=64152 RepID=A0AA88T4J5_CHASR|nr:hypothetical protein Q5P01_002140 [Channa striata]
MIKINLQRFYPYGLKSLTECISRATLLSQPADIPNFLSDYMSELLSFRDSCREMDPKLLSFNFQELYENIFFTDWTQRNDTMEMEAELREALETLFSGLISGNEDENVEQTSAATEADLSVSKVSVATVCKTNLKQTTPPRVKTGRVPSVRVPHQGETAGATRKTVKVDSKPCPASYHPSPTSPAPKTKPRVKIVPSPSRVMTGHVKLIPKKNVLPPIPQENRVVSKLTTCKDKEPENTRPQLPTFKVRVPEKTRAESLTARITRQESIRTMRKTLKDRKPDSTRAPLPPIKEEPEIDKTLISTGATTTDVTKPKERKTQTQLHKKKEYKDKKTKSKLAKVYKPKVPKRDKTNTHLVKRKPKWTFEQPRSSRVRCSVRLGPVPDLPRLSSEIPRQGSACRYYRQLKAKAIFYIV